MKLESFQYQNPLQKLERFHSSPHVESANGINRLVGFHVTQKKYAQSIEQFSFSVSLIYYHSIYFIQTVITYMN